MANERVQATNALTPVIDLAGLIGGQKQTSTSKADTSQLQALLQQLQGVDYTEMLKALFTQASGQIPGLQTRFGNAIGVRSGGSAAEAQIERLLSDTLLRGQDQIARLQQGNQQLQAQVAGSIANANKTQTTRTGTDLTRVAGVLGGLKAAQGIMGSDLFKKGAGKVEELGASLLDPVSNGFNEFSSSLPIPDFSGFVTAAGDSISSGSAEMASAAYDWLAETGGSLLDTAGEWFGFADGGLVPQRVAGGRASSTPMVERLSPQTSAVNNQVQSASTQPQAPQLNFDELNKRGSSYQKPEDPGNTPAGFVDQGLGSPVANALMSSLGRAAVVTLLTGQMPIKPMVQAVGSAANKMIGATDALNSAPDPLGAMLAAAVGKQVISPETASSLGSDNLAAAANSVTALAGTDPLESLLQITNSFGTGPAPGGSFGGSSGGSNYRSPADTSDGFTSDPVSGYAKGGAVERYFHTQKPHPVRSTDTVPAMLTPGEYVLRAEVVDKIGVDLLEQLNNMTIR